MAKKSKNELIIELLASIEEKIDKLSEKIDNNYLSEEICLDIDEKTQILIPEELYLEMCSELGEDFLRFMGIS